MASEKKTGTKTGTKAASTAKTTKKKAEVVETSAGAAEAVETFAEETKKKTPACKVRTIGVMTSGGDAPGMNAAVRAVVRTATSYGIKVKGIYRGFSGLIYEELVDLDTNSVSDILQRGGTFLYTARCPEMITKEGQDRAAEMCKKHGIDAVVVIGGDGSFRGALALAERGINVIGVPGTIDLDIACTEYTIGFDTAVNTAMDAIDKIRDSSTSHERCSIIEVMGRAAGFIALWCGIANGAEAVLTTEMYNYEEQKLIDDIKTKRKSGRKHYIIINAEGIGDSEGMAKRIEYATGVPASATILGYLQRGGSPTCKDRVYASAMGAKAVDILVAGGKSRVVAYKNGAFVDYDIEEALKMKKSLDPHLVAMLGRLTRKGNKASMATEGMLPAEAVFAANAAAEGEAAKVKTIGVMTSGEDAPGMNAAIRAVVRSAIGYDMKVWGIYRGFAGLIEKDAIEMTNKTMSETVQKGGTLLLATECPEIRTPEGREKALENIKALGLDALVVIGGDDSFKDGLELVNAGVNVIGVPATIDLDVACTEYTIGFDTAVNTAMQAIDKVRDTSASHERCSIIEVAGAHSAYNALWCGIANGAEDVVTERGTDRDEQRIISDIIGKKKLGKKLHLIVNSESVGRSKKLAKNIEFATGLEARATILGQLQRGGTPSCQDRVYASAMGGKAIEVLRAGGKNRIVACKNSEFVDFDYVEALEMKKTLDPYMVEMARKLSRRYTKAEIDGAK